MARMDFAYVQPIKMKTNRIKSTSKPAPIRKYIRVAGVKTLNPLWKRPVMGKLRLKHIGNNFLIEPTTEARLKFIREFIPKWLQEFEGDTWEVAHRLAEEIQDNFQFVPDGQPLPQGQWNNGQLKERVSLAHVMVYQEVLILRLIGQLTTIHEQMGIDTILKEIM